MVDEQDRIRPHVRVFVSAQMATSLEFTLGTGDGMLIVAALSGG